MSDVPKTPATSAKGGSVQQFQQQQRQTQFVSAAGTTAFRSVVVGQQQNPQQFRQSQQQLQQNQQFQQSQQHQIQQNQQQQFQQGQQHLQQIQKPSTTSNSIAGDVIISSANANKNDDPVIIVENTVSSNVPSALPQQQQQPIVIGSSLNSAPASSSLVRSPSFSSPPLANQQRSRLHHVAVPQNAQGMFSGNPAGTSTLIPVINQQSGSSPMYVQRQFIRLQPPVAANVPQQTIQAHNNVPQLVQAMVNAPNQQQQQQNNAPANLLQPVLFNGTPVRVRPISVSELATTVRLSGGNEGNLQQITKRNFALISPIQLASAAAVIRSGPQQVASSHVTKDELYKRKHYLLKKSIKSLVFKNAALCDEVARLHHRIHTVTEERKFLLRKLLTYERIKEKRTNKKTTAKTTLTTSLTPSAASGSVSATVTMATPVVTTATSAITMTSSAAMATNSVTVATITSVATATSSAVTMATSPVSLATPSISIATTNKAENVAKFSTSGQSVAVG